MISDKRRVVSVDTWAIRTVFIEIKIKRGTPRHKHCMTILFRALHEQNGKRVVD